MTLLSLSGRPVLSARITLPRRGTWIAEIAVDTREVLTGRVVLATFDGAFQLAGTLERGGVDSDTFCARVVGGAGGLERDVPPQAYRFVPARTAFEDAVRAAGETLSPTSDPAVLSTTLPYWTRAQMPCAAALSRLADALDASWRVTPDGAVWVGRDAWPDAPNFAYETLEGTPDHDRMVLGVDAPRLLPGTTFRSRRVSLVVHTVRGGRVRSEVWFEREGKESGRLFEGLRRWLEKALVRMDTLALYPARVVAQNDDGSLELKPDSLHLPGLSRVPMRTGLPGVRVRVDPGARALVAFEEGDPKRPVATLWEEPSLIDLRVGGERGVARIADTVVVPVPEGYEFTAIVDLAGGALNGKSLYPGSKITLLPAPKALVGTIVTGSSKLKA